MRSTVIAAGVLLLCLVAVSQAGAAEAPSPSEPTVNDTNGSYILVTYHVSLDSGAKNMLEVRAELRDVGDPVYDVTWGFPRKWGVLERRNMSYLPPLDSYGPNESSAMIRYSVYTYPDQFEFSEIPVIKRDGWSLFVKEYITPVTAVETAATVRERFRLANGTEGYLGERIGYLGPKEEYLNHSDSGTVRLVVPEPADPASPPNRTLELLSDASGVFDPSAKDNVTVLVSPDPVGTWVFDFEGTEYIVDDDERERRGDFDDSGYLWGYVHTQLTYDASERMYWFRHAAPDYFSRLLALQTGNLEFEAFQSYLNSLSSGRFDLRDTDTWTNKRVVNRYGVRALARIDAAIRNRSDGHASLTTVVAEMNDVSGNVTYETFDRLTIGAAGAPMSDLNERAVTGNTTEEFQLDPFLYTTGPQADNDDDGLTTRAERKAGTHPFENDTDTDGLSDGAEIHEHGTDPNATDTDGEGLTDSDELARGASPTNQDTDGDGLSDRTEVEVYRTNATRADSDGDGLSDHRELATLSTEPTDEDTDIDGVTDGREVELGAEPTEVDSDGDGLLDGREVELGTKLTEIDTDGDGLTDGREFELETRPTEADTDGDGTEDGAEIEQGRDPLTTPTATPSPTATPTTGGAGPTGVRIALWIALLGSLGARLRCSD